MTGWKACGSWEGTSVMKGVVLLAGKPRGLQVTSKGKRNPIRLPGRRGRPLAPKCRKGPYTTRSEGEAVNTVFSLTMSKKRA